MAVPSPELPQVTMHLLANPGDSLLLQYTLDRLLKWVCAGLQLFHVSERASPLRGYARPHLCPSAGYPALAVTLFLHEAYGEERILRVLDFLQRPPWQYHHTESGGARSSAGIHITSSAGPGNTLLRPYLLPSRDFYSLGGGMPVWGVRPVHCGGEVVRLTLHSAYDNYEDAVRFYETVLGRRAEEQKAGFCWFTLALAGLQELGGVSGGYPYPYPRGVTLQLALKQLAPGVRVQPCSSAVLQFRAGEIGQLVPLLPNPCSPISATRWQTEDLDGNKILFQVKGCVQAQQPFVSAFPLHPISLPASRVGIAPRSATVPAGPSPTARLAQLREGRPTPGQTRAEPRPEGRCAAYASRGGGGGGESVGSDSCCSTPPGSSCYSSQRSSPAPPPTHHHPPATGTSSGLPSSFSSSSLSFLLLEEEEEEEPETNVDTGCAVVPSRPGALGPSALETLAMELSRCLPDSSVPAPSARTWAPRAPASTDQRSGVTATATSPQACTGPGGNSRTAEEVTVGGASLSQCLSQNHLLQAEEFFI
ncbi:hypothetical protein ACEWY4_008487 [Coilia grayii]|uniref:FAM124 domain-containing protein n=1 Tax=Coilia grayii TaxID=363190 RepID=A0ABD1KB69_9TELE